jgi:hypothetical protein
MQYTLIRICKKLLIQIATLAYLAGSHGALGIQPYYYYYLLKKYTTYATYATFFGKDTPEEKR